MNAANERIVIPRQRSAYTFWHSEKLRSYDMDAQRHINNNVQAMFCEEGRRAFIRELIKPLLASDTMVMVARYGIEFLREMPYPGNVDIGVGLLRCGNSSITLAHALFTGDICHAVSDAVVVFVDPATRRGSPMPEQARAGIARYQVISDGSN